LWTLPRAAFDQLNSKKSGFIRKHSKLILIVVVVVYRSIALVLNFPRFVCDCGSIHGSLGARILFQGNRSRYPWPLETSNDVNEDRMTKVAGDENEDKDSCEHSGPTGGRCGWSAELVDFWHCLLEYDCRVQHHYMLYPNPYPNPRLKQCYVRIPPSSLLHLSGRLDRAVQLKQYLEELKLVEVVAVWNAPDYRSSENCAGRFFPNHLLGGMMPTMELIPVASSKPTVVQRSPSAQASWTNFEASTTM
jgi:hypothetical protein